MKSTFLIFGTRLPCPKTLFVVFMMTVVALTNLGCDSPSLQPWHTEKLTAEFSADKIDEIQTFDNYRKLEEKLFSQLEEKVYTHTGTGPKFALTRYSSGSMADPLKHKPNWNRSFELETDQPVGGVLLLHGMSDSPYSLRALGKALNKHNYWVVGLRLPGHGTAPSGLKYISTRDMSTAVKLGMEHLALKVGNKPTHIVGYSTGAALALDYTLDAIDGLAEPMPASLVLVSPAIGVHPSAALASVKDGLSIIPGLGGLAWLEVRPEFDPYKYNSFATNGGDVVHRLTQAVSRRIAAHTQSNPKKGLPPILVFKSTVDATVSTDAVVDRLLMRLTPNQNELVLFDINRFAVKSTLLVSDPAPLTNRLLADENLPFVLTLVTNENPESEAVIAQHKEPFSTETSRKPLNLDWPRGVISLSHVALPFPPDDPLYGALPPKDPKTIFLGQMAIKGERNLLLFPSDWLLRLRHNPFYDYLETRLLNWVDNASNRNPTR